MSVRLFAIGLLSILAQVVLLRELHVAFYGSELIYVLALGVWMVWTGLGAFMGNRGGAPAAERIDACFILLALLLVATVAFERGMRRAFGAMPGAYLAFPLQLAAAAASLLPVAFLLGLLFQWVARRGARDDGRTLARAYVIESLGGVAGGTLAGASLAFGVSTLSAALAGALASIGTALLPRMGGDEHRRARLAAIATLPALALVAALIASGPLDRRLTRWDHPDLLATADTPYGRVTVTGRSGQVAVFENGALAYENEGTTAEEFVQLAALQPASLDSVLVIGGAVEGLVDEVLRDGPRAVDDVELDGALLDLVTRALPARRRAGATARIVIADPRRFLRDAPRYDLILVGMPQPESASTNRYYTSEFFRLCAGRLRPGGVLALRLRSAENLWTPPLVVRNAGIHRSLREVFTSVVALPGTTCILLASNEPLMTDPAALADRLETRGIHGRLVTAPYIRYLLTNDRYEEMGALLATPGAAANRDARPVCHAYTLLVWLSRFVPVRALSRVWSGPSLAIAAAGIVLIMAVLRGARRARRGALVGMAALAGMILESAILLDYQVRCGVLFRDIAFLVTAVMAGLAGGAFMTLPSWSERRRNAVLLAGLALLALVAGANLHAGWARGLAASTVLLAGTGFLVGAIFASASASPGGAARGTAGHPEALASLPALYAADLAGGAAGSLLAALILVPAIGTAGSALFAAGMVIVGFLTI